MNREDKIAESLERTVDEFLKNQGRTAGGDSYPEDIYRREDVYRYDSAARSGGRGYDYDYDEDGDYEDYGGYSSRGRSAYDDDYGEDEDYSRRGADRKKRASGRAGSRRVQNVRQTTVRTKTRTRVKRKKKRSFSLPSMPQAAGKAGRGVMSLVGLVLRIVSAILFLVIDVTLIRTFWPGARSLGSITAMVQERNWALALYLVLAAALVGFGIASAAWALTTRKAGDGRKLRSYDTGRGLLAFLVFGVIAMFSMVGMSVIPYKPEILVGLLQLVLGVMGSSAFLLKCSVAGAVLCIVRRLIGS